MRLRYLPLLLSIFISGCVNIEQYPDSWDKIKTGTKTTECPPVTNTYLNRGEKPDGTKVFLAV
jgi:hypothetical protein